MGDPLLAGATHEYVNVGVELASVLIGARGVLGTVPGIATRTSESDGQSSENHYRG